MRDAPTTEIVPASDPGGPLAHDIDVQIATARRYPRSIAKFLATARSMALIDAETAASCHYRLPPRKKADGTPSDPIEGPSIRLAEIVASAWTHLRIGTRIVDDGDRTTVTVDAVAWDMERNVAISRQVKRRTTTRSGTPYGDDMRQVATQAATSVAIRNAIFSVVPVSYVNQIYREARARGQGDEKTLAERRTAALRHFTDLGVPASRVCATLGVAGEQEITLDHIGQLHGLAQAAREGTSIEELFPVGDGPQPAAPPPKKKRSKTRTSATASTALITPAQIGELVSGGKTLPALLAHIKAEHGIASLREIPAALFAPILAVVGAPQPPEPASDGLVSPHRGDANDTEVLISTAQRQTLLVEADSRGRDLGEWLAANDIATTQSIPAAQYEAALAWVQGGDSERS